MWLSMVSVLHLANQTHVLYIKRRGHGQALNETRIDYIQPSSKSTKHFPYVKGSEMVLLVGSKGDVPYNPQVKPK